MNYTTPNNEFQQRQDTEKKHNTSATSIESFRIINKTGQRQKEKEKVLQAIREHQPVSSRTLCSITRIERSNITRVLFDLVHEHQPKVKEWGTAKCEVTGRSVKYYTLSNYSQQELKF